MASNAGSPGPEPALDVPVRSVGGPRGNRRARRAAAATVLVAASVVVLALPKPPADGTNRPQPSPLVALATDPPATTRPRETPSATPQIPANMPNLALVGAPRPAFFRRVGDDLRIQEWVSGDAELRHVATVEGAYANLAEIRDAYPLPSPDGRSVLIQVYARPLQVGSLPVRLVTLDRGVVWEGTTDRPGTAIWSADSRHVALAENRDTWWLVDLGADPVAARRIDVGRVIAPTSTPYPGQPFPTDGFVPAAFSDDGAWIYGVRVPNDFGRIPAIRVATSGDLVEATADPPATGGGAPLAFRLGLLPARDPVSGRVLSSRRAGEGMIQVREGDGRPAFDIAVEGAILEAIWIGDGRLITIATDDVDEIGTLRIVIWGPDGTAEPALLVTNRRSWVAVTDLRAGHLLLGLVPDQPSYSERRLRLALIRLSDVASSYIDLGTDDLDGGTAIGWFEAPPG